MIQFVKPLLARKVFWVYQGTVLLAAFGCTYLFTLSADDLCYATNDGCQGQFLESRLWANGAVVLPIFLVVSWVLLLGYSLARAAIDRFLTKKSTY